MEVPVHERAMPRALGGVRSGRQAVIGAAIVSMLLLAGCSSTPSGSLVVLDVVELDMHRPDNGTATATGPMLEAGRTYTLTIEGTYSIWSSEWNSGACGGISESEPMIPSPGGTNGVVGVDAEFYFAVPNGSALCSGDIPRGTGGLEISLDGGADFDHPDPVSPVSEPDPNHTYVYEVVGEGHPIMFERVDSPSDDNYGVMRITIGVN